MSEYYIISEKLSITPLMMLDDIFDKLDNKRISDLMKFIKNKIKGQIFITDALNDRIKIFNSKDFLTITIEADDLYKKSLYLEFPKNDLP